MDRDLLDALKALTHPTRLRIWASLVDGPAPASALSARLGIPRAAVDRHLRLLVDAALIGRSEGREPDFSVRVQALASMGRRLAVLEQESKDPSLAGGPDVEGLSGDDAKVVRSFVHEGRLASIPVQGRKRQVILRWLLDRCFDEDRAYPEKEVNQRLGLYHPDVASLRRYLVDSALMTREGGIYRRASAANAPVEAPA
ncbi:MAG TPA: DUF2087 domain-containing protein [Candidatus Limnocylindrales bacterium]